MTDSAKTSPANLHLPPVQAGSAASEVPPSLEIGSHVGSFQLRALISEGPSTAVYLAQDSSLGVDVAIKEFRLARGASRRNVEGSATHVQFEPAVERGLRAFVEEARLLARCVDPSLLSVRGLFESQGTAYRVMPHYRATGLIELRASMPRPPDEPSVRAVLNHLLGALEALHATGHVHGALIASNVLLLPDDRPLLMGPGSAAHEAELLKTQLQPDAAAPAFADQVSEELKHLADLAEFCITGVQRAHGHVREPGDTVTAAIVRELGAVELRHYSAGFLSVLDVASSTAADNRPLNAAHFSNWLGSHEVRRMKQPAALLSPTSASLLSTVTLPAPHQNEAPDRREAWANTAPPSLLIDAPLAVSRASVGRKSTAPSDDFMSSSQIWADTVQVLDDSPLPTKRPAVYPPQPMPQGRPNFEKHRAQARNWTAGLGTLAVGLMATLLYVSSSPKDPAVRGTAVATPATPSARPAGPAAAAAVVVVPPQPVPLRPAALPAPVASTDMPEIRLPVAERFSPGGADSAASAANPAAATTAELPNALAAAAAVAAAPTLLRSVKPEPKKPVSGQRPKGVGMSKAAWANGPRAACSANSKPSASAASCLKTQCGRGKWVTHPQCARPAVGKASG